MRLRDYTPRGYNARLVLILIVPMMIFVVSMTLYFFTTHVQQVNSRLSRAVADELAFVNGERTTNPQIWVELTDGFRRSGLMDITFTPGVTTLVPPDGEACCDELGDELRSRFRGQTWSYRYRQDDLLTVRILMSDGLLEAKMDRKRVIIINAHIFIVW
ncbi:MAG TPA: hypothetical protein PK080_08095, partial [Hyphomonadaceae bacterium]|nr:hypothetical protein [Hyphomonadaceae bacterium]